MKRNLTSNNKIAHAILFNSEISIPAIGLGKILYFVTKEIL